MTELMNFAQSLAREAGEPVRLVHLADGLLDLRLLLLLLEELEQEHDPELLRHTAEVDAGRTLDAREARTRDILRR